MNGEQNGLDLQDEEQARKEMRVKRDAQAIKNVSQGVATFAPGPAGAVGKGIVIADKVTNNGISRVGGKVISKVPGGDLVGSVAGNRVVTGAAKMASLGKDNPSKDGFSEIKGKDFGSNSRTEIDGGIADSAAGNNDEEKNSFFGSEFLSTFFGELNFMKIAILFIIIGLIPFLVVFMVVSVISEKEQNSTALAVSVMSVSAGKFDGNPLGGAPGLTAVSYVADVIDLVSNKIDFKIFNKDKPSADEEGNATARDSSSFGDYLSSLANKYPDKFVKAFYSLGSIFGSGSSGCSDSECLDNPEVAFYQKVSDISYRYRKLYNIELDWPLITATLIVNKSDKTEVFSENLSTYTVKELNNLKKTMSLDWDYNYKEIPGYDYLSGNDSRYDLQILAKNMVTKKTTQTCSTGDSVSKKTELVDVEDYLIEDEKDLVEDTAAAERKNLELEYYLLCDSGQTYSISSTYTLDKEKYDEFLDEFLETKYFIKKNGGSSDTDISSGGGYSLGDGTYGWPLPQGATSCLRSGFGPRVPPKPGASSYHQGHDYSAVTGTSVYAIADGVVEVAKSGCGVNACSCNGGAGNYVVINHGNGVYSVYMHSSNVEVSAGQHVTRGQEIMKVGSTGCSTGPHLHIGIKIGSSFSSATYVDPTNYIGALPKC